MSDVIPGSEALLLSDPQTPRSEEVSAEGSSSVGDLPVAEPLPDEGDEAQLDEEPIEEAPDSDPEPQAALEADPEAATEEVEDGAVPAVVEAAADAPEAPEEAPDVEEETDAGPGPGDALSDAELERAVAALVFASPEPLGNTRLGALLEGPRPGRVKSALAAVQATLEASGLPLELRQIAGGWRLMTAPTENEVVARLVKARKAEKLSPAGLETLAVVAYRQPVTKAEIEAIRGVQCGAMLRNLVDRGLAKVVGRADVPGGPLQYGTTKEFLDRFGMGSLADLPRDGELLKE